MEGGKGLEGPGAGLDEVARRCSGGVTAVAANGTPVYEPSVGTEAGGKRVIVKRT